MLWREERTCRYLSHGRCDRAAVEHALVLSRMVFGSWHNVPALVSLLTHCSIPHHHFDRGQLLLLVDLCIVEQVAGAVCES